MVSARPATPPCRSSWGAQPSRGEMGDLVLWGAGGHGKVVFDVARAMGVFKKISFIDDVCGEQAREFCACQVLAAGRYLQSLKGKGRAQYVASIGNNKRRAACFQRPLENGLHPATLVHPSAVVSESARLEDGTVVMARVVINAGAWIGKNCIVNTTAVVEHDCRVGDHVRSEEHTSELQSLRHLV